jgi:outer membrane receptor for ferrienterochelin and colicin
VRKKRHCKCCRLIFLIIRNPEQQYCGQADCQRARKNQWRKNARQSDADYRSNQRCSNRRWQASHPDYWKRYRASHQKYVHRNREKQRVRDQSAKTEGQKGEATHLAKSDAFFEKTPIPSGSYWLTPVLASHLAKSDAFFVKIDLIPTG